MSYKGTYKPKNMGKFKGPSLPKYKSGLERSFMIYCDNTPSILEWFYEGLAIPYHNPIKKLLNEDRDGINAKYYPDFYIKYKNAKGVVEEALIEVKMKCETRQPKPPTRRTNKFKRQVATYAINEAKWAQARVFCNKIGFKFIIITEEFIKSHASCI